MKEEAGNRWSGLGVTGTGILVSRLLGLARDSATAALLGMSGGAMDAFVVAFRIPNLFRRLFGEGALTASYVPVLAEALERGPAAAGRLAGAVAGGLTVVLLAAILLGEALCGWLYLTAASEADRLLLALSAALLPYALLVCLTALFTGTLQTLGRFAAAAAPPLVLNVVWLIAALAIAPRFAAEEVGRAYVLAGGIVGAGLLQVGLAVWLLRSAGFHLAFASPWREPEVARIAARMSPALLGLAATQFNTFADSLIAWFFAAREGVDSLFGLPLPLESGAAAAAYYGERLYQFPLGIVGVAVATVIFPRLARHAARKEMPLVGTDLTQGLLMVLFLGVPASAGLVLLAEPLARLLFEHGEFTAHDAERTAGMIACYSAAVWAYCGNSVIVRGFHAVNDQRTPLRAALAAMVLNLVLNLTLIWPLAERGLAVATAAAGAAQFGLLIGLFHGRHVRLDLARLGRGMVRFTAATLAACLAAWLVLRAIPAQDFLTAALRVAGPLAAALGVYFLWAGLAGWPELRELLPGARREN